MTVYYRFFFFLVFSEDGTADAAKVGIDVNMLIPY